MMSLSAGANRSGLVSEINVTPMADIMIVLLIIFMVATPVTTRGLDAALPQPAATPPGSQPPALVMDVPIDGIMLNRKPMASLEDLDTTLREQLETRSDRTLFVHAAPLVPYGRVVAAMDVAKAAGAARIGILPADKDGQR